MQKRFLMGNEAIALGALASGVNLAAGYPGTPSTEVLETVARHNPGDIYVEWSVNEKAAMELAGAAAYSGARTLVTMKQMGLNVASDPLMCLRYIGVKGGMVVLVADDPGPISSQTEQDTRKYAEFSKVPCFDPSSVEEAYLMIQEAFDFSEKYHTPVFLRPTTRVCHAYATLDVKEPSEYYKNHPEGFIKDSKKWVIFPRLAQAAHRGIAQLESELSKEFSDYARNFIKKGAGKKGLVSHGISYAYIEDVLEELPVKPNVLKISTPYPFPEKLAVEFLKDLDEVLCVEELDPVLEKALVYVCGKYNLKVKILGRLTGDFQTAGENTPDYVLSSLKKFLGLPEIEKAPLATPELPVRPPVLCAGCPHRASFLAVKIAMRGEKTVFCGDIGCYTLGNAMPLDMVDTCLCMGAGVNMAQGFQRIEPDTNCFAFVGDSTFFASAITGAVNAAYNGTDMTLVILDNSTTAMTGHQPHPGTGVRMMDFAGGKKPAAPVDVAKQISIEKILQGIGLAAVEVIDPLNFQEAVASVKRLAKTPGVKAIIFRSPCIALLPKSQTVAIGEKCINCKKCLKDLGCPALTLTDGKVSVDETQCNGCGLCTQICPCGAITKKS